jgi:xanthine dehydrogenase accessory factor
MESIYARLNDFIAEAETVAVATIIDVKGSVPREVGAKMIIHPLGQHVGTVGGGCGEADVIKAALDVIQTGEPATVRVDLTEDISMQSLGVCGGIMDVFVERVGETTADGGPQTDDRRPMTTVAALRGSMLAREPVALATVVSGPAAGAQAVVWLDRPPLGSLGLADAEPQVIADAQAVLRGRQHRLLRYLGAGDESSVDDVQGLRFKVQSSAVDGPSSTPHLPVGADVVHRPSSIVDDQPFAVFIEVQRRAPELLIVGGGHIAVPLAQLASMCDFSVTVLDDRPSFASPARFPTAQKVLTAPLRETVRDLPLDHDSFIVLVTRGHSHDVECLQEVLDRPVAYIGMIGSQRRVDAVIKLLVEEQGIDPIKLDRVYAPIGIAIGARTPAEIGVCIMAEIINVYRGGPAVSISDKRRERDRRRRGEGTGDGG